MIMKDEFCKHSLAENQSSLKITSFSKLHGAWIMLTWQVIFIVRWLFDTIHADKQKWLNMTRHTKSCYVADVEKHPYQTVKHKSHIPHIMLLAAAARLPYCHHNRAMWDQKIGIFECVDLIPAKWTLHNRPAGTIEAPP